MGRSGSGYRIYAASATCLVLLVIGSFVLWRIHAGRPANVVLLRQALAAMDTQDLAQAARLLDEVLKREPSNRQALLFRGQVYRDLGESARAARTWESISDEFPREAAVARQFEGMLAYSAFRARQAEPLFLRAKELDPAYLLPRERLYHLYKLQMRDADLRRELFEIRELRPLTLEELSRTVGNMGKIHPAPIRISDLENLIANDAGDIYSIVALAECYLSESRFSDAVELLERSLKHNPDEPSLRGLLAEALLKLNEGDRAALLLEGAPPVAASAVWLWRAHADYRMSIGECEAAARYFERALELDPDHIATTYNYGMALERSAQHDSAAKVLERAQMMDQIARQVPRVRSNSPRATDVLFPILVEIGRLLVDLGRATEAIAWLEQALEWRPNDAEAREAYALARQKAPHETPLFKRAADANAEGGGHDKDDGVRLQNIPKPDRRNQAAVAKVDQQVLERLRLADRHGEANLEFQYDNGDRGSKYLLVEAIGGGVAAFDFDADGWPDLFFPQGCPLPVPSERDARWRDRLFRNERGTFRDVSEMTGIDDTLYGQGCSAGDFDNDGFADLAVANLGPSALYHNNGDGTFRDVTREAGITGEHWNTSLAFADLDRDGCLDLYIVTYVLEPFRVCGVPPDHVIRCSPLNSLGEQDVLYRSLGDGTFEDISASAGILAPDGKGLGIVVGDLDDDGWLDIYIANDSAPNFLFHNETGDVGQPLRFVECAMAAGAAVNGDGHAQSGMGAACGDFDGDLRLDLVTTNFYLERTTLYQNQGSLLFMDVSRAARLDELTRLVLGWGVQPIDIDLNGHLDMFIANGHIDKNTGRGEPWKMRPQLLYNSGKAVFSDASRACGEYFDGEYLGRGAARLDWDRDGLPDLVVVHTDRPVALLRNETRDPGHRLVLSLHGVESNRDAIGARITVTSGGTARLHEITGGDGYLTSNERRAIIGLGSASTVERLEIRWPSGRIDHWTDIPADAEFMVIEGRPPIRRRIE